MKLTLLGTGAAGGVPAAFCDCEYCTAGEQRRRSGLLVEAGGTTLLFDASPELRDQVLDAGVTDPDAAFVTHFHRDHAGGLPDLAPAAAHLGFDVHLTRSATVRMEAEMPHAAEHVDPVLLRHGDPVTVGDCRVVPFPVAHGRPEFDALAFAIYADGAKAVYAPDVERFLPGRTAGREYEDADLLVVEGGPLFWNHEDGPDLDGRDVDGERADLAADLRASVEATEADRTVLTHVSEHFERLPTGEMRAAAASMGYELGRDFATYRV